MANLGLSGWNPNWSAYNPAAGTGAAGQNAFGFKNWLQDNGQYGAAQGGSDAMNALHGQYMDAWKAGDPNGWQANQNWLNPATQSTGAAVGTTQGGAQTGGQVGGQTGTQAGGYGGLGLGGGFNGGTGAYGAAASGDAGSATFNGGGMNPYLQQQAQGYLSNVTQNLQQNILPGVRAQMRAVGGYGDSRDGIIEAQAIQGANRDASAALASILSGAYESDANRGLQKYGIDTNANTAKYTTDANNATSRYGIDTNAATSRYGIDTNAATAREGFKNQFDIASLNDATNRYGIDTTAGTARAGFANALDIANLNNATTRYGIDTNATTARDSLANQFNIASMGNDTTRRGQDLNQTLGLGNLAVAQQNANTNQTGTNNQYQLGLLANQLGIGQLDLQKLLGGSTIETQALNNQITKDNALWNAGQREQNAQIDQLTKLLPFLTAMAPYTGTGAATGAGTGGGAGGAIGGAIGLTQLLNLLGLGGK